ncbi:anaerobic ribonucleoside-triphosphate reductase activating protein [Campylobacter sp.]|uniref:anaerobic ribonucleoside-triphosphate reductase activating protein n=1 Tax=Campylobacter sp. TaxID=205 RepID=UPI003FA00DB2
MQKIFSITPFTTLDYPDKVAAVVWFAGCNMRCVYCYNVEVVDSNGTIGTDEVCSFLDRRIGKLNGIVFSGGECTANPLFLKLAREVKARNFCLKVDTNGSHPEILKSAIDEGLIDYIALDFKAPKEKFVGVTGSNLYEKFSSTLKYLLEINFDFEVRTTVHADLLSEIDIAKMSETLYEFGYRGNYYLQKFFDTGENFGNLSDPKNSFDLAKITSKLPIKLRNF